MKVKIEEYEQLQGCIEILYAIETLEYHNKNYLIYDDKKRNKIKRGLLDTCINIIGSTSLKE